MPISKSLLIVYTGDGKGKTTAALGMVFRALGRGLHVGIVQFIKGNWTTGERLFLEKLPQVTLHVMGLGFTWESKDIDKDKEAAVQAWRKAQEMMSSGQYDIVILDEITYVMNFGFVPQDEILQTLRDRNPKLNVVITGRDAPRPLIDMADLVTEMKCIKHPFDKGIPAKKGIDY